MAADLGAVAVAVIKRSTRERLVSKGQNKSISATLATATCALLGSSIPAPVQAQEEPAWDFNTAVLFYGEDNDRVQDASVSILATRNFEDDRSLTLGLTVDALTGGDAEWPYPATGGTNIYATLRQ